MLVLAGLLVIVVTVLEALALASLQAFSLQTLLVILLANVSISSVVGYFLFAGMRAPRGTAAASAQALQVVGDTLPLLRRGLNPESAAKAAEVIFAFDGVHAVVISDRNAMLATTGDVMADLDQNVLLERMQSVMESRRNRLVRLGKRPVAIAALRPRGEVVGALALVTDPGADARGERDMLRFVGVLAQMLSMQVELGQSDRQAQLAAEAELTALRAQINPHFLFNALNTIIAYSREDPQTTRRLLLRLADLFRGSMQSPGQTQPFADEYEQVKNYLYIEQARFREKLQVAYDIDPQVLKMQIPALSVQPLVENAVRHGITPKAGPGTITLKARVDFMAMRVVISVHDDGVGLDPAAVQDLLKPRKGRHQGDHGLGLSNINERLRRLYGEGCRLHIDGEPGAGTTVTMRIPMR